MLDVLFSQVVTLLVQPFKHVPNRAGDNHGFIKAVSFSTALHDAKLNILFAIKVCQFLQYISCVWYTLEKMGGCLAS
jgi:hypothetical protein